MEKFWLLLPRLFIEVYQASSQITAFDEHIWFSCCRIDWYKVTTTHTWKWRTKPNYHGTSLPATVLFPTKVKLRSIRSDHDIQNNDGSNPFVKCILESCSWKWFERTEIRNEIIRGTVSVGETQASLVKGLGVQPCRVTNMAITGRWRREDNRRGG